MKNDKPAINILVVDDQPLLLRLMARVLPSTDPSVEVVAAHTGREALEALEAHSFDLCFLDVGLPDMSGLMVMEKMRAISPETRIAVMTASHLTEAMKGQIREGAWAFIEKPFRLADIRKIVNNALIRTSRNLTGAHSRDVPRRL
ncbi:MAG: response regulator [Nitrospirota bacterium]|jgi:DNA-binding NtrC family response regulator